VTIPVSARLTAHRKSACWAPRRLDGPTTNLRYQSRGLRSKWTDTADDLSRWCQLPQRLHTPTPNVPAGQRCQSPASTVAWTRTSRRIPGGLSATRFGLRVYAGHRPATQSPEDRQTAPFRYPHRVYQEGLRTAFPQVRGPLAHAVAGEGFEPSKLSRWIYRPWATRL